jgi:uncharacterized membrane protein YjgN (DUF898 family)
VLVPFAHQRLKAWQHGNSWFGNTQFSFHARAGQFYKLYLLLLASMVLFIVIFVVSGAGGTFIAISMAQKTGERVDPQAVFRLLAVLYGTLILLSIFIGSVFHALLTNLIWNNTRLGEHRFECRMSPWGLMWIIATNFVLVVLTLGLYIPWAMVRVTRFHVEAVRLLPASDLQEFVAAAPESVGAVGEEAAAVFDFDIAL